MVIVIVVITEARSIASLAEVFEVLMAVCLVFTVDFSHLSVSGELTHRRSWAERDGTTKPISLDSTAQLERRGQRKELWTLFDDGVTSEHAVDKLRCP